MESTGGDDDINRGNGFLVVGSVVVDIVKPTRIWFHPEIKKSKGLFTESSCPIVCSFEMTVDERWLGKSFICP